MKKRILSLFTAACLLLCTVPFFTVSVAANTTATFWNGGVHAVTEEGYEHVQKLGYGDYYLLRSVDARGKIPTPNLDEGPYYMAVGMSGYRAASGDWAQLTISYRECNHSMYPSGSLKISFPAANGLNGKITVNGRAGTGTATSGVYFIPHTAYIFKFAKVLNTTSGEYELVVSCNGVEVFRGVDELKIFDDSWVDANGINEPGVWFVTECMYGSDRAASSDTFGKNPLLINPVLNLEEDPDNYFVSASGLGLATNYYTPERFTNNILDENFWTLYDADGSVVSYIDSEDGSNWNTKESTTADIANRNNQFEVIWEQVQIGEPGGDYSVIGWYGAANAATQSIFNHAGWTEDLDLNTKSGSFYWRASGNVTVDLLANSDWSQMGTDRRLRVVLNDAKDAINIYINDVLARTISKNGGTDALGKAYTSTNVAGLFTFMETTTWRMGVVGNCYTKDTPPITKFKFNTGSTATGMVSVNMEKGASVRWDDPAGIRFETTVSGLSSLPDDAQVEIGTLILPYSYLSDVPHFTKAALDAAGTKYVDVKQLVWSSEPTEVNDYYLMKAALVNIKEKNYAVDFAARSYVKVTLADGTADYVYSEFDETDHVRSVAQVAYAIYQDTEVYTNLSTTRKANVDKYAAAYVA